jgi:hypothetical protein
LKQPSQIEILEKLNFVVTSGFLDDQFGGVKRSLKFLDEARSFDWLLVNQNSAGG